MVERKPPPCFRVGESIPESGLYKVFHAEHRLSHKSLLLKGQTFPRCAVCADEVHFEMISAVPEIDTDPSFASFRTLSLYEIPHPAAAKKETA